MKCLACGGEMRLMGVRTDTTTECGIERHTLRCSACAHTAQRLMLNRVRMPITSLPVVIPRNTTNIDLRNGHAAAESAWASAIDKVNSKQAELKRRAAATIDWGSVVEKLSTALKHQAGAARAAALARALEKLRSQQMALDERAAPLTTADRDFDRIWYGQCADEVAPKPVASGT